MCSKKKDFGEKDIKGEWNATSRYTQIFKSWGGKERMNVTYRDVIFKMSVAKISSNNYTY